MSDEILKRVDALAAKLGVAANHIWVILVRQARIEAVTDLIWAGVWAGIAAAMVCATRWLWKREEDRDEAFAVIAVCVFFGCFCTVSTLVCVNSAITELFNPEYFALQQILKAK